MRKIYDEVKTPYKYGVVVRSPDGALSDSPCVFRHGLSWYMIYITMNEFGYSTRLAKSSDLLKWIDKGEILKHKGNADWDGQQSAGYAALQDCVWGGSYELQKFDGKYWMTYLGGALKGYETDPLAAGLAYSPDPSEPKEWTRLPSPVITAKDKDAGEWESLTVYKTNVILDKAKTFGSRFIVFYNAKRESGYERIGMAFSDDLVNWKRYEKNPIIDSGKGLSGDPQVAKIGDIWVMFYFGADYKQGAFETFACSYDLKNWTRWNGPNLVSPSEDFDKKFAHKPWVVKHDGVVYHFYCAVGSQGRVIALATSKDFKNTPAKL